MTARNRGFLKVPNILLDSGVFARFEPSVQLVYLVVRKYERRQSSQNPTVERWRRDGYLVSYVNANKLAIMLGRHRQTIGKALRTLAAFGFIRPLRLKDNARAYIIGETTNADGQRKRSASGIERMMGQKTIDGYYLDTWLEAALAELPKDLEGWKHEQCAARVEWLATRLLQEKERRLAAAKSTTARRPSDRQRKAT